MSQTSSILTFDIICLILFGEDIHEKLDKVTYINPTTGQRQRLDMHDSLERLSLDCAFSALSPLNVLFPQLVDYNIGTTNRIN